MKETVMPQAISLQDRHQHRPRCFDSRVVADFNVAVNDVAGRHGLAAALPH